ncbi:putative E3 ubiquitin-protein ligase MARCHF10 [Discoglossus pictus]
MAGDWTRRNLITNGHHMRDVQHKIDSEYQTYLRRQEREREQAESARESLAASQRSRLPHTSVFSARSYERPWKSGMNIKKHQVAGGSGRVQESSTSKLPAINKDTKIGRKKTAPTIMISPGLQPQAAKKAIEPRILVQKKRLHMRQLPASLGAKDGREEGSKWPAKSYGHSSLNSHYQDRIPRPDPMDGALTSVITSSRRSQSLAPPPHTWTSPSLAPPAHSRTSPSRNIEDCFNELLERSIDEPLENDEGSLSLEVMGEDDLLDIQECPFPNSEREAVSWRSDMDCEEEPEDDVDELSRGSEPSIQRSPLEPNPTGLEEEIRDERPSSAQVQDRGRYSPDLGSNWMDREETTIRLGAISSRRLQPVISSPSVLDNLSLRNSETASLNLIDLDEHTWANTSPSPVSVADTSSDSPVPPASDVFVPPEHVDHGLQPAIPRATREQSVAIREPSSIVPYLVPLGSRLSPTSPRIEVLRENLQLAFLTLSMRRSPARRDSERIRVTTHSNEAEKPKADPEKLKMLRDSLLQDDSDEEEGDLCRICLMGGDTTDNHMVAPCHCTGSLKYVHQDCLKRWLTAKIQSGAELDMVRTCEMCKQSVEAQMDGFNVNEQYRRHQEAQQGAMVDPSLYLVLLLHMYEQRYEELLHLSHTRDQVTEISRRFSHLRAGRNNRDNPPDPDPPNHGQIS